MLNLETATNGIRQENKRMGLYMHELSSSKEYKPAIRAFVYAERVFRITF